MGAHQASKAKHTHLCHDLGLELLNAREHLLKSRDALLQEINAQPCGDDTRTSAANSTLKTMVATDQLAIPSLSNHFVILFLALTRPDSPTHSLAPSLMFCGTSCVR